MLFIYHTYILNVPTMSRFLCFCRRRRRFTRRIVPHTPPTRNDQDPSFPLICSSHISCHDCALIVGLNNYPYDSLFLSLFFHPPARRNNLQFSFPFLSFFLFLFSFALLCECKKSRFILFTLLKHFLLLHQHFYIYISFFFLLFVFCNVRYDSV